MIESQFWYKKVTTDIDNVVPALNYYERVHLEGIKHTKMKGVIHKLLEDQAQLMQVYEDAHTDCSMLHKWFEEQIKVLKARKRIEYMKDPELKETFGELKKTDIENFVIADETIQSYVQIMLLLELWSESLEKLVTRISRRGIYLTMISKLRIAGEHEAYIDTTHETNPETL